MHNLENLIFNLQGIAATGCIIAMLYYAFKICRSIETLEDMGGSIADILPSKPRINIKLWRKAHKTA